MYQWCEFKSCRGKNKNLTALKSNSITVWFNFQTYIYIYEKFENAKKGNFKKDRQYNDRKKTKEKTNNDPQNIIQKIKD